MILAPEVTPQRTLPTRRIPVSSPPTSITDWKSGHILLPRLFDYWRRSWSLITGKQWSAGAARVVPRSERHAVQRPLIYRHQSGLVWYNGITENLSSSGVLFRGEKYIPVGSVVETSFEQQDGMEDWDETPSFCWAQIVRTLLPATADPRPALGAKVLRRRCAPKPPPDVRELIGEVRGPMSK